MSVIDYSWDFTKEEFSLDLDFFNEKEQEDKLWQARTGLNLDTLCGAIETIIFMSDRPVNLLKIKSQIDSELPLRVVHEAISRLQEEYEAKHHGIRLMEVAQGYQFRTKATYSKIIQNMFKVTSMQLSPTALEVLAIIAYKQPLSKTSVESIRGVDSSHVIRQLMDKRLVRITGRSEEMGRPSLYGTTAEFLEIFNLNTLDELPSESELHELATATDLGQISDIKSIVSNPDKKVFDFDEFDELEELSSQINEISAETMFTETLKSFEKKRTDEEGIERKSAFDILEDFVNSAQVIEQNKEALLSEILMSAMLPRSVDITTTDELLNVPAIDDEEAIESPVLGASEDISEELFATNALNFEAEELADALDLAFDNLMSSHTEESETDEDFKLEQEDREHAEFIEEGLLALDEKQQQVIEAAKDLDLDLNFMNED